MLLLIFLLEASGYYVCVSSIHRKKGVFQLEKGQKAINEVGPEKGQTSADFNAGLPVVAFRLSDEFKKDYPHVKQETVSNLLRAKQFIIPSIVDSFSSYCFRTNANQTTHFPHQLRTLKSCAS